MEAINTDREAENRKTEDEVTDAVSPSTRLPVLIKHAATARESDAAKRDRLSSLGSDEQGVPVGGTTEMLRLRYAPPPTGAVPFERPAVVFPAVAACAKREADSAERLRVLHAMEAELRHKQTATARCFHALHELCQQPSNGSRKALLQQIFAILVRASYKLDHEIDDVDASALDELAGHEYFSLYSHAQQSLEVVALKKQQLESKLQMEQALEHELVAVLQQLERDLHAIRTQHLENHERVEAERTAVAQLEEEHAALIRQDEQLRRECDGLAQQAARQHNALAELQSKSAYLDFISRIPLKKHLEHKKLKEQEELLLAVVESEEAENAKLERELAALNAQMASLDEQYDKDVTHREQLKLQVIEAEQQRDATQREHHRLRDCHTPRPAWDAIIERIPELSNNDSVAWDEMQAAMAHAPAMLMQRNPRPHTHHDCDQDSDENDDEDANDSDDESEVGGQTQELVGEVLQWIERLQKHCGVNLHLSRIWHDVEDARVELNILQHQLDQAVRKYTRYGGRFTGGVRTATSSSSAAAQPKQRTKQEYICAMGVHNEIPLFLRHQGKVKRHPLAKSEVETLVRKVWTEKRQREKRNPHLRLPLEEVLYEKLHRKFGFQPLIAEWGYNILLSLDLYAWDAEIELFLLCLTHAISDQVFLDQEAMLAKCSALLDRLSESYGNESFVSERRVLLKDALVALRKFFPLKTSSQLQALEKAMIRDMHKRKRGGTDSILYIDDILPHHASYPRGFFVKAIRQQHFKEIQDYYATLATELETRDAHKTGELPLRHIREAMLTVDPLADQNAVWSALMRGMGVKTRAQIEQHEVVPYKLFLRQMNSTGLLKFALNFDPHAERQWHRLNPDDTPAVNSNSKRRQSTAFALAARSRPTTSDK